MRYVSDIAALFKERKYRGLRKLYKAILNEVVEGKEEYLELAILSYALSKLLTKHRFLRIADGRWEELETMLSSIKSREDIDKVEKFILKMENEDRRYIFDIFTKARIKIAATLYAKGVSLGKSSKLTGIPKQEILSYAGKTMMFDRVKEELTMKERVKLAKEVLEG